MKIKVLSFVVCLLAFACTQKQDVKTGSDNSKEVIAVINKDSTASPVITFIGKINAPKTIAAGKPEVKPNPNSDSLGAPTFTNYNTEQGLALSSINCGYRDKTGNLWFGTDGGGVSRYDGKSFTNFTTAQGLVSNAVYSIVEDKTGNLWFATGGGGVSRYDGKSFTNFTTAQGLANNFVYSIGADKTGNLWFGTNSGGVSLYDGKSFTNFTMIQGLANNTVRSIAEDKTGNLWFATEGGGVSRYDGKSFTNFTTIQGLASNTVWSIMEDKTGNLWFGTRGSGVSRYDGKSFTNFTTAQGLANNTIRSITEDKTGNIWFATDGGVSRYNGKSFTNFTTVQGLTGNIVYSITEDKTGNLWFGIFSGGVNRYDGKSFTNFTTAQGLANNSVWSILEDKKGNLWFGTSGGGVSYYDRKSFTNFTTAQGLASNTVRSIAEDKTGNLWFATEGGGVSRYDGKSFTNFTTSQGLASNTVRCIAEDKTGNFWFATEGSGVSRYDGKSFTNFTTAQGLASNIVYGIVEDKTGNLWFATEGSGVSRYNGKSFTNFTTVQGLANNTVLSITEDKRGNLWFGTADGGVSRYDGKSFLNFTAAQGLADNVVYDIVIDSQENIFIGTNLGFSVLKGFKDLTSETSVKKAAAKTVNSALDTGFRAVSNGEIITAVNSLSNEEIKNYQPVFELYNQKTGYPVKDLNTNAMFCDSKGIIWGGCGDNKLVRFDYNAVVKSKEPPAVFIQAVKIREENISWYNLMNNKKKRKTNPSFDSLALLNEEALSFGRILSAAERDSMRYKFSDIKFDSITRFYPLPENLVLPYNHNSVTFDFVAIEPARHFLVRYQYILEGYDRDWGPITDKTSATFGNIHEGVYTFRLKARSPDGIWNEPITYTFKVLPPWWRTWWFRTLMGISLLFLLYGIYRWRTATLRKQKRILEQTVKERTAEVVKEKAEVEKRNIVIQKEKEKSDELLLNILPSEVAEELKEKGYTTAKAFDEVTVLFSDIKGFTNVAEKMSAQELVKEIDTYFSTFDNIIQKYGLEKIKTIGDAYIAAGGLPEKNSATAQNVVEAAIAMQKEVEKLKQERISSNKPYFELRIGIHTGPVVAGVVGIKKFQYDIWGDTVNLAARMEQSGIPGKINISQHTYEVVKEQFTCVHRGKIEAKNKGEIDMYFVE
jgi:ligand-binding sensor domain-containing protein/class 3 adenylate cyclase